jgi:hypothetical protein
MKRQINKITKSEKKGSPKTQMQIYAATGKFKGEVNLQWDSVRKANLYVVELAPAKTGKWKQVDIICSSIYTIEGLKQGCTYLFRVAAVYINGQGPWSKPVAKKI